MMAAMHACIQYSNYCPSSFTISYWPTCLLDSAACPHTCYPLLTWINCVNPHAVNPHTYYDGIIGESLIETINS